MPNTILTPLQITRKALMILHQKLNFIGTINKQYDDQYAKDGAKIGDTLRIRKPNRYTVRTTVPLGVQDTIEQSINLVVAKRMGVDTTFTSAELTLSLDDFSTRILDPAMSVLAANLEADAMTMYKGVYNIVQNNGAASTLAKVLQCRKILTDNLAPLSQRYANLNTQDTVDIITDGKALFNDKSEISSQYKEGRIGRAAGFDFYENTLWPRHTQGTHNTAYTVGAAGQTGAVLGVAAGTGTILAGDVFTIAGVFAVHPETKQITTSLQQFTATSDYAGGAGNVNITPAIVTSGGAKNVNASPGAGALITFVQAASGSAGVSMFYHRDAFTFATVDLIMPNGVDFKAREVFDGISMRIIRAYDINSDAFPCRIDVQYGYTTLYEQLACRLASN